MFLHSVSKSYGVSGAYESAEVASDAFCADDMWFPFVVESDGLMSTVHAGDITPSASDAPCPVNLGEDHSVSVEFRREYDIV